MRSQSLVGHDSDRERSASLMQSTGCLCDAARKSAQSQQHQPRPCSGNGWAPPPPLRSVTCLPIAQWYGFHLLQVVWRRRPAGGLDRPPQSAAPAAAATCSTRAPHCGSTLTARRPSQQQASSVPASAQPNFAVGGANSSNNAILTRCYPQWSLIGTFKSSLRRSCKYTMDAVVASTKPKGGFS